MPPAAFSACIFRTAMLPPAKPPPANNAVTAAFSHRTPPAKTVYVGERPVVHAPSAKSAPQSGRMRPFRMRKRSRFPFAGIGSVRNYPAHEAHSYPAYEMPNIIPRTECKFVSA